jgi:hypothetical protein
VSARPETPLWRELERQAAVSGVLAIAVRDAEVQPAPQRRVVELTWPGGEVETLRFATGADLDALAHALAAELGLVLAADAR